MPSKQQILLDVGTGITIELAVVDGGPERVKPVMAMMRPHVRSLNVHLKNIGVPGHLFRISVKELKC